jgi:phosphatidylserine decarboxylase
MVKEGYKFAAPPLALGLIAGAAGWRAVAVVLLILAFCIIYFFRDPERIPPSDPGAVVSPADGRVMEVVSETLEGRPGQRVSIFLAIWDVHVNRSPMAGRLKRLEYRPGRFYNAMRSRASRENEQNVIHLETEHGEIVFKQIAGAIARRVVCWKAAGDTVQRGERIGLIRFGSRMDVWLPESVEMLARPGQHVAAGTSILARWP